MVAVLAVIAIHLVLYSWLRNSNGWRMRHGSPVAPALVTLRLLPLAATSVPRRAAEPKDFTASPRPVATFGPVGMPTSPTVARDRAAPPAGAPTITQADAGLPPAPPASQASQATPQPLPLNLTLRPGRDPRFEPRNPALDDPRANTARTTPEQRLAGALDTRVIEEDLGGGRRRIRRGDQCVMIEPSRIGQLMPFNEAATRSPSLVGACP